MATSNVAIKLEVTNNITQHTAKKDMPEEYRVSGTKVKYDSKSK